MPRRPQSLTRHYNVRPLARKEAGSMQISLYHNPRCSKSRAALALLRDAGVEPTLIDYLNTPPSLECLVRLVGLLGVSPRALLRTGETEYQALNLAQPDLPDAAILAAIQNGATLAEVKAMRALAAAGGSLREVAAAESGVDATPGDGRRAPC